jgi:hypothetical protein
MPGIHGEGDTSANPDFKDALVGLDIEVADGGFTSFMKHSAENFVVDTGVGRIDPLNFV